MKCAVKDYTDRMISWKAKQADSLSRQFDTAMEKYYPSTAHFFRDHKEFHRGLTELWNYLDAIKILGWGKYIRPGSVVLDLAGGTGWLSGYLSVLKEIKQVYCLDPSVYFLNEMMPGMVKLMGGDPNKITSVEAVFSPLLFENESIDLVVVSSSLHHADNLEAVLKEINRILRKDSYLIILNEVPFSTGKFIFWNIKFFILIMRDIFLKRYKTVSQGISSAGLLYDPYLYDKAYPLWYWKEAIKNSGFSLESIIDSGMRPIKTDKKGGALTHFICRKN